MTKNREIEKERDLLFLLASNSQDENEVHIFAVLKFIAIDLVLFKTLP